MLGKSTGNVGATFKDRADGGKKLAQELSQYGGRSDVVVLGLPRGGVPVAYEVAKKLEAPLDVFIVRKLGVPGHEELAMGVGAWYEDFPQTKDEEVKDILEKASERLAERE